jgi:hypothetical protein
MASRLLNPPVVHRWIQQTAVVLFFGVVPLSEVRAREHTCEGARRDLLRIDQEIELYMIRSRGRLPPEDGWAQALFDAGITRSPHIPLDRWGRPILFEYAGDSYEVMTLGHDGVRGTEDDQVRSDGWADHGACRVPDGGFCRSR